MSVLDRSAIIISAYACDPSKGSEPGAGWQFVLAGLDAFDEVFLVTRQANVGVIDRERERLQLNGLHVVGVDGGQKSQFLKANLPAGHHFYYVLWQFRASSVINKLQRKERIVFGQHVTYASDWLPTALARAGVRDWIWGPVGGRSKLNLRLWRYMGAKGIASGVVRLAVTGLGRATFGRRAAMSATMTVTQNEDVAAWARKWSREVLVLPNPVIDAGAGSWSGGAGGDLIGIGRLLPWKGWALALRAFALTQGEGKFRIYGGGPDRARLERLAYELEISDRVVLEGTVPRDEVLEAIRSARAVVLLSFHDSAGWAVAEAVTVGAPVIGLDVAGIGTLLRMSGGLAIDSRPPGLRRRVANYMMNPPMPATEGDVWHPAARRSEIAQMYRSFAARSR